MHKACGNLQLSGSGGGREGDGFHSPLVLDDHRACFGILCALGMVARDGACLRAKGGWLSRVALHLRLTGFGQGVGRPAGDGLMPNSRAALLVVGGGLDAGRACGVSALSSFLAQLSWAPSQA